MVRPLLLALTSLLSSGALTAQPPAAATPITLELLSAYDLPGGARFEGTCIGGLSALFYDAPGERYFAVSDSRRDARFYVLRVEIRGGDSDGGSEGGKPHIAQIVFERVARLHTREGLPYPDDRVDPEGFTLVGEGEAFISSEGVATEGVAPFVDLVDVETGEWLATAPVPLAFKPRHRDGVQVQGTRNNLGFESLTSSPDRRHLYVATESALAQDVTDLEAGAEHFSRLLHYALEPTPRLAAEVLYPLTYPAGEIVVHGLVELLALDDRGRFLALERTWGPQVGMVVKLFEFSLDEARGRPAPSRISPPSQTLPVIAKRLVLDFADLPIVLDNFEGLTLGPRLADGSESLLVLGDNDNVDCAPPKKLSDLRPTKLLLFRMER